jgi:hypothetical protein
VCYILFGRTCSGSPGGPDIGKRPPSPTVVVDTPRYVYF